MDTSDSSCKIKETQKPKKKCPPDPAAEEYKSKSSIVEMPHILRTIGPKQISVVFSYVPPLIRYGAAALVFLIYTSEFRTILQYLPYYNGKYEDVDYIPKKKEPIKKNEEEEEKKKVC